MAFVYRKESKEALSGYAYTQIAIDSHSVLKAHGCLKFLGDFFRIQLPKYLSRNSYSIGLGGVWASVVLEIYLGDSDI